MPLPQVGNSQYTALTNTGTTTLNPGQPSQVGAPPGQSGNLPASFGVFYGLETIAAGTGFGATVYDLVPPTLAQYNAGTSTQTLTLLNGTNTAGVSQAAGLAGVGVRYKGALVVVTTGTPGQINALWD
jgi:hypothetical protein